jgi:hypothetical protein
MGPSHLFTRLLSQACSSVMEGTMGQLALEDQGAPGHQGRGVGTFHVIPTTVPPDPLPWSWLFLPHLLLKVLPTSQAGLVASALGSFCAVNTHPQDSECFSTSRGHCTILVSSTDQSPGHKDGSDPQTYPGPGHERGPFLVRKD